MFPRRLSLALLIALCTAAGSHRAHGATYWQKVLATRPTSIVGAWALNETSGTVATDASGNGNHGTYSGVLLNGAIHPDGLSAPRWDGVNDAVTIPSSSNLNPTQITICAWVQADDTGYWRGIVSKTDAATWGTGYGLFFSSDQSLTGFVGSYGSGLSATFAINDWVHLCYTRDSTTQTLYQNGSIISSAAAAGVSVATDDLYIGLQSGGRYWWGAIARVAIWNEALSASEISDLATINSGTLLSSDFREVMPIGSGDKQGYLEYGMTVGDIMIISVLGVIAGLATFGIYLALRKER